MSAWIGVITQELEHWGIDPDRADSFACEYILFQPYELETGGVLLGKRLRDLGLDEPKAAEAATTLMAVSLFTRKRTMADVGRLLRSTGVDQPTSLGAAMDAARIRREIEKSTAEERPAVEVVWERLAPALVVTGLAAILFVLAGTIG